MVNESNMFLTATGHPRCGTGFFSALMKNSGLQVGHEKIDKNGIVSWMLVSGRTNVPWGETLNLSEVNSSRILVARSPLKAINSVMFENGRPFDNASNYLPISRSFAWRASVIYAKTGIDILIPSIVPQNHVALSVASLVHWFGLCLREPLDFRFRVDVESDLADLSEFLGVSVISNDHLNRNHKPSTNPFQDYRNEMLRELPAELISSLVSLCETLGYPEDAIAIQELV